MPRKEWPRETEFPGLGFENKRDTLVLEVGVEPTCPMKGAGF
jgi:hypothetical protein